MILLSIIIPVYNEENTITGIIERVRSASLPKGVSKEIILINDGSNDDTHRRITSWLGQNPDLDILYRKKEQNEGKGAAIRDAIKIVNGQYVLIQDADLEYDPSDYKRLLQPVLDGFADVVYGSRFMGGNPHRVLYFWHSVGNKFLTLLSNAFTNLNLTDMETCYKLFPAESLKNMELKEKRFGFEPEVTAKIAKIPGIRIYEVGINYYGRTYEEGKKIDWKDGVKAIYCILKYNVFS